MMSKNEDIQEIEQSMMTTDLQKTEVVERIQAGLVVAKRFPRNQSEALRRIKEACSRLSLAEQSMYSYPRGGKAVTGPSIRLAEVLAQCWGNISFGVNEIERHSGYDGYSVVEAYAWDLETNTRRSRIFTVPHKMRARGKTKVLTDPRDIYELMANQGARRERACVLGVIPPDVVEFAVGRCRETLMAGDGEPLIDRVNKMVLAFSDLGVSQEMLERKLGHEMKLTTVSEIVDLKAIYISLKDGQSRREDWFAFAKDEEKIDKINEKFSE